LASCAARKGAAISAALLLANAGAALKSIDAAAITPANDCNEAVNGMATTQKYLTFRSAGNSGQAVRPIFPQHPKMPWSIAVIGDGRNLPTVSLAQG
jgi:hypothetical protein